MDNVTLEESILASTKKMLGIEDDYTHFDPELIFHINSTLFILFQLGALAETKSITSREDTWDSVFEDIKDLEVVKSYIYAKVKLMFDQPTSATVMECYNKLISELEWRISINYPGGKQ